MAYGSFGPVQSAADLKAQTRYEASAKNLPQMTENDWHMAMAKRGVVPRDQNSLPVSPLLMHRHTKELFPWIPEFAEMHDPADQRGLTFLFVNCDKDGNTDPAAWEGKPVYIGMDGPDEYTLEDAMQESSTPPAQNARILPPNILLEADAFGLTDYYKDGLAEDDIYSGIST